MAGVKRIKQPIALGALQKPAKARIRVRTHLTSFQINDAQKANIDEAYKVFKETSGLNVSKGAFIEGLAQEFLSSVNAPTDNQTGSLEQM